MPNAAPDTLASAQVPPPGALNLDHVAHFVPDSDAAAAALARLGFTLTPFSAQSHRLQPEGPLVPAGTGNRCVMLERGYLEFLTPTADTPVAAQLRAAIARCVGVHLIALGTAAPEADHARLDAAGFVPLAPVALQRQIGTPGGEDTARFTVVRVPPGTMAEGRIQFCRQHTPHLLWQSRWTEHANAARSLDAVFLCVENVAEAAARYARYTGLAARPDGMAARLDTARGALHIVDRASCARVLGVAPPVMPWIAGYALGSADLAATRRALAASGAAVRHGPDGRLLVDAPAAVGGVIAFAADGLPPLSFA